MKINENKKIQNQGSCLPSLTFVFRHCMGFPGYCREAFMPPGLLAEIELKKHGFHCLFAGRPTLLVARCPWCCGPATLENSECNVTIKHRSAFLILSL